MQDDMEGLRGLKRPKMTCETFIELTERGLTFEVSGRWADGSYLLAVRGADGIVEESSSHQDLDWVGRAVDARLARLGPVAAGEGFQGLEFDVWNHETCCEETFVLKTRGAMMAFCEEGELMSVEEAVEQLEFAGDTVLNARDGTGRELLDKRDEARAKLTRIYAPEF